MNSRSRRIRICVVALVCASHQALLAQSPSRSKKLWIASLAAFAASNSLDLYVSRGHFETNPLLRDSQGRLSLSKGLLVKSGLSAAAVTAQLFVLRKASDPGGYTSAATLNFAAAGGLAALAVRNHVVASRLPP